MAGKFVVKEMKSGWRFNLVASNGQVIATSESYSGKEACLKGVESVRKNCAVHVEDQTKPDFETLPHPKYEVHKDKAGEFRFRLKARNGEIIATGEGYKAKTSCLNGIDSIGRHAPDAGLEEIPAE